MAQPGEEHGLHSPYPSIDGFYFMPNTKINVRYVFGPTAKLWVQSNNSDHEVLTDSEGAVSLQPGINYSVSESNPTDSESKMTAAKLRKMTQFSKVNKTKTEPSSSFLQIGKLDVQGFMGTLRTRKSRSQSQLTGLSEQMRNELGIGGADDPKMGELSKKSSNEDTSKSKTASTFSVVKSASTYLTLKKKTSADPAFGSSRVSASRVFGQGSKSDVSAPLEKGSVVFARRSSKASIGAQSIESVRTAGGVGVRNRFDIEEAGEDQTIFASGLKPDGSGADLASIVSPVNLPSVMSVNSGNSDYLSSELIETPINLKENSGTVSPNFKVTLESDMPVSGSPMSDVFESASRLKTSNSQKFNFNSISSDARTLNVDRSKMPVHPVLTGMLTVEGENRDKYFFKLANYKLSGYADENCFESEEFIAIDALFSTAKRVELNRASYAFSVSSMPELVLSAETEPELYNWITTINATMVSSLTAKNFDLTDLPTKNDPAASYRRELNMLQKSIKYSLDKFKSKQDSDEDLHPNPKQRKPFLATQEKKDDSSGSIQGLDKNDDKVQKWGLQLNEHGRVVEKSGSCVALLETMVDKLFDIEQSIDLEYLEFLLCSYRHVTSSENLLALLIEKYIDMPDSSETPLRVDYLQKWRSSLRIKALYVLKRWINEHFIDFVESEELMQTTERFLEALNSGKVAPDSYGDLAKVDNDKYVKVDIKKIAESLLQLFKYHKDAFKAQMDASKAASTEVPKKKPVEFSSIASDEEIAHEITRVDFEIYSKIRPVEFYLHLWSNKERPAVKQEIKHIDGIIERFNNISYWVATEICTQPELKNRITVLERIINIAKELRNLNNYNSLMAVMSGLNVASVQRLKATWEGVNQKLMKSYTELEDMVSPQNNFGKYRDLLCRLELEFLDRLSPKSQTSSNSGSVGGMAETSAGNVTNLIFTASSPTKQSPSSTTKETVVPVLPIISLFLKDLLFMSDGNPKILSDVKMINFAKLKSVNIAISRIIIYQKGKYELRPISPQTLDYCANLRALKEAALYKYSKLAETRAGEQSERLIDKWAKEAI